MNAIPKDLWRIVYGLTQTGPWPPARSDDIARFFDFANRQCLLPLLMADEDLPPQVLALKPRYRLLNELHRKGSDLRLAAAAELTRSLGSERFLFYKGSDYQHRLYEKPEHRVMGDIDVFVPATDIQAALAQLQRQGYKRTFSDSVTSHAPGYHEKRIAIGRILVELHHSFGQRIRAGIDYAELWRRREPFNADGVSGLRLAPADAILCHAFNLGKDEFSPELNRYVDLFLLLQKYQDQLPVCVDRAKAWGIERTLFGALHIATTLFSETRTATAISSMDQLLDRSTRQFLVKHVLPDPAVEGSGSVLGRRVQIWRKFMLMDRKWRGLAFVGYHLYAIAAGTVVRRRQQQKSPAHH